MNPDNPSGYTIWTVFRRGDRPVPTAAQSLADALDTVTSTGVTVRGIYDVSAMRADADLMIWLHGDTAEGLQAAVRTLRRSTELSPQIVSWSAMGVHRDAEFNRAHVPGFLRGIPPKTWLTVYPFVRSYDWYVLPEAERRDMLAEHGRKGAAFRGVTANTVAAFALNDYEWILPLESDELTELVDLMRDLRATGARLHVREEIPFFTGRRIEVAEVAEVLR